MPIENRNLEPGTKLIATYKKEVYHALVVASAFEWRHRHMAHGTTAPPAPGCPFSIRSPLLGGCDAMGYPPLQEQIAEYLTTSRGVRCSPDQIAVVAGGQAALDLLVRLRDEDWDDVLETNAEDFVKSYVQKGGQ